MDAYTSVAGPCCCFAAVAPTPRHTSVQHSQWRKRGGLEETTHKELRHGNTAWSGGFSESSPTMRLTTRAKESPRPGVDKDIRGRRHAISPRSAKVRVVRDAPRQSGHRRTAPVSVRVFLILRKHSSWILRRTQRKSAVGSCERSLAVNVNTTATTGATCVKIENHAVKAYPPVQKPRSF